MDTTRDQDVTEARVSRKSFLKTVGVAATAAAAGPTVLTGCFGSAAGGGAKKLTILKWSHFVPAFDTWFDNYTTAWGKKNNVTVVVDHVPTNTVVSHASSEVAAGTGHDLTQFQDDPAVPQFQSHLVDVSDVANKIGSAHGGWIPFADFARINGTWKAIPDFFIPYVGLYRKDLYQAAGLSPSDTWEELIKAGEVLKPKGHPVGIAIASTYDSNSAMYSILWSYGGKFVDSDGKTVAINSPETRAALQYVTSLYQKAMNSEVLSWNDASNNRYLDSGVGSWIYNPISAYRSASTAMQKNIYLSNTPAGPSARLMNAQPYSWVIWKWSKVPDLAKKFLSDFYANWMESFKNSTGYNMPMLHDFLKKPMPILGTDPKLQIMQDVYRYVRPAGWPGPSNVAAGQVWNTFVIPTMFAKAARGESPDSAVSWAESQLKSIYSKYA